MLLHPQLQAESWVLLGNRLNAALLWPHASALSIFINLLNNLFFSTLSQHVEETLLSHWLSFNTFQNQQRLPALKNKPRAGGGGEEEEERGGGCSYSPPAALHMKISTEMRKRKWREEKWNRVFMLGLKRANLMAALFFLATQSWYREEMEGRGGGRIWLKRSHLQPNFTFLKDSAPSGHVNAQRGGVYGRLW